MKKRLFCLILCVCTLFSLSAQASGGGFYRRVQYGALAPYENLAFSYSLSVYERFLMVPDDTDQIDAEQSEEDDAIYDMRIWYSPDGRFQLDVQVKEPTYGSFNQEIEMAPRYLELVRDQYEENQHVQPLHEGILREMPAGTMLETAISYDVYAEDGTAHNVVFVYYDLYVDDWEYCFSLTDFGGEYETAQETLDELVQTISVQPHEVYL